MSKPKTNEQILQIAREILVSEGFSAVSFDAIARRLGRSKQAVLYWFPNKQALLAAMFLPWLEAETDAAIAALVDATDRTTAIDAFVRAVAGFHFDDLDRFRMMYLVPQTTAGRSSARDGDALTKEVHPITASLYTSLAAHLGPDQARARGEAFAVHSSVLGLVLMSGLADALHDPLKHSQADLVDALIASLTKT